MTTLELMDRLTAGRNVRDVKAYGCSSLELVGGAGRDAVYVTHVCPTAMIFTLCKDGISHNPTESITPQEAQASANVFRQATIKLADA